MKGVAADRSLRAIIAASGAERLMLRIVGEVQSAIVFSPETQVMLDDLRDCATATARVAAAFGSTYAVEDQIWDIALATLARMNVRIWQRSSSEAFADHVLLMDVMESMLIDLLERRSVSQEKRGGPSLRAHSPAQLTDIVDEAIVSVLDLTGHAGLLSVQVLIGVALRAMSDAS